MDEALQQVKNELTDDKVVHIKDATKRNGEYTKPYSIGYEIFDKAMLGGVRGGDLVVCTGLKKNGKTSMCQCFSVNLAEKGNSCLWFSYEVIIDNFYAKFKQMGCDCDNLNLYSPKRNTSGNIEWIREKIVEGVEKYNSKFIFIDHLDFLTPKKMRNSDQERIIKKQICLELKDLAKELEISIFLVAHVKKVYGRNIESQDIAETAGAAQLADFVFGIQRSVFYDNIGGKKTERYGDISTIRLLDNRLTGDCPVLDVIFMNNRIEPVGDKPIEVNDGNINDAKETKMPENEENIEVMDRDKENDKAYFWQKD